VQAEGGRPAAEPVEAVSYEQALESADQLVRLKAHAIGAVAALVPATVTIFVGVNRRLSISEAIALQVGRPDFSLVRQWRRYCAQGHAIDPFAPDRMAGTRATVLRLADVEEELRVPYAEHLAAVGMGDRATMFLRSAGTIVATIALIRSADMNGFTSADVAALRRLHALVEQAYTCASEPGLGRLRAALARDGLTEREADVAGLVGRGATNAEIAGALHLGQATVKTHLTRIYAKLGVRSRTQLALLLARHQAAPSSG
jgi:DNA-binding CsgD family transcriptional regulator